MNAKDEILNLILANTNLDKLKTLLSVVPNKTLKQFQDEYLEAIRYTHKESYLQRSVKPAFKSLLNYTGNVPLSNLNIRLMEKYFNNSFHKSKYTTALYYRVLKAAFNKAIDWNYIDSNPIQKIKIPKIQKVKPVFISESELEIILNYVVPENLKDVYKFLFFTGLRAGELINLKWNNVNLNENILQIGDENFQTKSKEIRFIPIPEPVKNILINLFPNILKTKNNYVFKKSNGFPYSVNYLSKQFKKAVKQTNLDEKIHLHSLRHSFASNLVQKGVPLATIKELLGHSSISVTEIYAHVNFDTLRKAIDKVNISIK